MPKGAPADTVTRMTVTALIVAAGRGRRAGPGLPKQYRPLAGRAVLTHTAEAFLSHQAITDVRVVINPDDIALYHAAVGDLRLGPPITGGAERQDSVRLGLEALTETAPEMVLIHDAARPFVAPAIIDRVIAAAGGTGGAIAALPVVDSLTRVQDGLRIGQVARDGLWRAQTPQGFRFSEILAAHRAAAGLALTDDAAVAERHGIAVAVVAGSEAAFKLTTDEDFGRAEKLIAQRLSDVRVGQGFDVHAFSDAPGRVLMLGGIALPGGRGLAGHSDADVVLHAATDAILGALAEGDIGQAFPPSDPQWKNAPSWRFLSFAADRVAKRGGLIAHLDLTIICEAPKIGPHRAAMQMRIAEILGVAVDRVAVKATTTEKLGFTGRGEGIAAQAVATVRLP